MRFLTHVVPQAEWRTLTARTCAACETLAPGAAAALHRQTITDTCTDDMAALAASVSAPGLKERICRFRESNT